MNKKEQIISLFEKYSSNSTTQEEQVAHINFIKKIVDTIRPKKVGEFISIHPLLDLLSSHEQFATFFRSCLSNTFQNKEFISILTDVGIPYDVGLKKEFTYLLMENLLPEGSDSRSVTYLFNQIFSKSNDYNWIKNIPNEELIEFFRLIKINEKDDTPSLENQLYDALSILATRANGKVHEKHFLRLSPAYQSKESPFEILQAQFLTLQENQQEDLDDKIRETLKECRSFLMKVSRDSRKKGISLRTNKDINRVKAQIKRIDIIYTLLYQKGTASSNEVALFLRLLKIHCKKVSFKSLIANSTHLLASEVLWYKAKTGEKYITESKKEYWQMFKAAAGGGFIVGILVIIKLLVSKMPLSTLGFALMYSANYSIGFILIYLFGFTLATKQPSMTGAYMVKLLKKNIDSGTGQNAFATFFANLFRSQFIAFVGNVVIAFPVAILGLFLLSFLDFEIPDDKTAKLMHNLNPWISLALLHAAIAGLYLFISGLIAGNTANKSRFYAIPNRIASLPWLKNIIGGAKATKLSNWYKKKWPGIMSNLYFGIFMGVTAPLGIFIGLNLDIRHITFAAGNFGMALFGGNFNFDLNTYLMSTLGIILIGIINFIMSFGLSLILAMRAKNIPSSGIFNVMSSIWKEFKNNPLSFFYPQE